MGYSRTGFPEHPKLFSSVFRNLSFCVGPAWTSGSGWWLQLGLLSLAFRSWGPTCLFLFPINSGLPRMASLGCCACTAPGTVLTMPPINTTGQGRTRTRIRGTKTKLKAENWVGGGRAFFIRRSESGPQAPVPLLYRAIHPRLPYRARTTQIRPRPPWCTRGSLVRHAACGAIEAARVTGTEGRCGAKQAGGQRRHGLELELALEWLLFSCIYHTSCSLRAARQAGFLFQSFPSDQSLCDIRGYLLVHTHTALAA
jgi:hypothetical protein